MTLIERNQKSEELTDRIANAVRQIQEAERKLANLRVTDIYRETAPDQNQCSLWSHLGLLQTHALSHRPNLDRPEEDPCFATLALLEELLKTIPQSVLQIQGCYIHTQDRNVSMCISFSTSVENLVHACESSASRSSQVKVMQ